MQPDTKNWIAFLPFHCIGTHCIVVSHQLSPFYGIFNININLQKMPLRRMKEPFNNEELKDLRLPKFGFRLKLTGFVSMLAWIGMIVSVFTGFGALTSFTTLIDYVRLGRDLCHYTVNLDDEKLQSGPRCFFSTGFGLFFALLSPYWFYLSFQLRKKVQEQDLAGLTKTLKAICYIQATFSVLLTGPLMVFPILKIIGMYRRRTAFVKIYIIFTIEMLILTYVLFIEVVLEGPRYPRRGTPSVTLPGHTVTLPGHTVTVPGQTVTVPSSGQCLHSSTWLGWGGEES